MTGNHQEKANSIGNDQKDDMLDLVNKVQMFRIAIKKINSKNNKKNSVFKLADEI